MGSILFPTWSLLQSKQVTTSQLTGCCIHYFERDEQYRKTFMKVCALYAHMCIYACVLFVRMYVCMCMYSGGT